MFALNFNFLSNKYLKKSILKNIGTDGSGIHHGKYNHFGDKIDLKKEFTFDKNLVINNSAIFRIKMFFNEINNKNRNYIYSKQTNKIFDFLENLNKERIDISTEVLPNFIGQIATFHNDVYHRDIGTIESYALSQVEILKIKLDKI